MPKLNLPSSTKISLMPKAVEYRTPIAHGIRVVRVELQTITPKFSSSYEVFYESEGKMLTPLALYLDDIIAYCQDALRRLDSGIIDPSK